MDLSDYLLIFRRNWILIVAGVLAGLIMGGAVSLLIKPTYTAETQLFVAIQGSGTIQELQQGNTFSQARIQSYVTTVSSPAVLQPAIDSLGLAATPQSIQDRVKATADPNTVLVNISVSDESAVQAAALAQAVAASLITTVDRLERPTPEANSVVRLSVIKPATAPAAPSAPNTRLNLFIGAFVGLMAGIGGAIVRNSLDSKIRGEAELRRITDAPLLGGIAYDTDAQKKPLLTQVHSQSPRAESFRQLRTNLQFTNVSNRAKSFAVTSSMPGEGKSTTATNLAIALAEAGQTVCLVDADLRRPMVNDYLGLDRNVGLTTALIGELDIGDLLQPWGQHGLYVLTSGQIPPNPSELLGSTGMRNLIQQLESMFDCIVIDAPPLLPVTDAAVLSQHVGGMVLVVASQLTRGQDVQRSLNALHMVGANLLGIVLNRLPVKGPDAYEYSYYSYVDQEPRPERTFSSKGRRLRSSSVTAQEPGQSDGSVTEATNATSWASAANSVKQLP